MSSREGWVLAPCWPKPELLTIDRSTAQLPYAGIFLMGYGLVAIPRTMWREADVRSRQRLLCHQAGAQAKKALDAHHDLTMVRHVSAAAAAFDSLSQCQKETEHDFSRYNMLDGVGQLGGARNSCPH